MNQTNKFAHICTLRLLPRNNVSPSASFLRHSSLVVAGLRAPLSRVLEEAIFPPQKHHAFYFTVGLCVHKGPFIKYVTLFLANFGPPVTLCHTSRDPQKSTSHVHLGPPPDFFSRPSTKDTEKSPLYKFSPTSSPLV